MFSRFICKIFLTEKRNKFLSGGRSSFTKDSKNNSTGILAINSNIKEDFMGDFIDELKRTEACMNLNFAYKRANVAFYAPNLAALTNGAY
jgi:hypothetical protein